MELDKAQESQKKRLILFIGKIRSQAGIVADAVEALVDNPVNENVDDLMIEVGQLQSIIYMTQKNVRIKESVTL